MRGQTRDGWRSASRAPDSPNSPPRPGSSAATLRRTVPAPHLTHREKRFDHRPPGARQPRPARGPAGRTHLRLIFAEPPPAKIISIHRCSASGGLPRTLRSPRCSVRSVGPCGGLRVAPVRFASPRPGRPSGLRSLRVAVRGTLRAGVRRGASRQVGPRDSRGWDGVAPRLPEDSWPARRTRVTLFAILDPRVFRPSRRGAAPA